MKPLRAMHYIMGTLLDCTLFDMPEAPGRQLLSQGVHEVRGLERLLSPHDPDSALSWLNRQAGCGPVQIEAELWQFLAQCEALRLRTVGAFDISAQAGRPSPLQTPALRLYADRWVELAPGVRLDSGGIGKGYAVDRLVALLRRANVPGAFINFGDSSLGVVGELPGEQAWPIVIRGGENENPLGVLWLQDGALSTSHSFGRRLVTGASHMLDPHTGLALQSPCLSTVVAPSATLAEALSTAVLVSSAAWRDLLTHFPEAAGLYVGPDGVPHCTAGLARCFQPDVEAL